MDKGIKGEMKREQSEKENESEGHWEENRVRGKWERDNWRGKSERENEKKTEGGLCFVYLLYTKRLLNLAPLTPPWHGITCKDNFIS